MNNREAIEVIKSNWPPGNYTMLREALGIAVNALEDKRIAELERILRDLDRKIMSKENCIVITPVRRYWHETIQKALSEGGADD